VSEEKGEIPTNNMDVLVWYIC